MDVLRGVMPEGMPLGDDEAEGGPAGARHKGVEQLETAAADDDEEEEEREEEVQNGLDGGLSDLSDADENIIYGDDAGVWH